MVDGFTSMPSQYQYYLEYNFPTSETEPDFF